MFDLSLVLDESMPPHALYVVRDGDGIRLNVSPRVEPEVLVVLAPGVRLTVADAIDNLAPVAKRPPA